jgi:hypothetical protein
MSTVEPVEPETISVTPGARIYLEALESYGLLEGESGQQHLSDGVRDLLHGLHHVLGGGVVSVELQSHGTSSIVDELDTAMLNALNTCGAQIHFGSAEARVHCM